MRFISHRGYWKEKNEQNSLKAFERSFQTGFGIETDVRDLMGDIAISHDLPKGDSLLLAELLSLWDKFVQTRSPSLPLALNIKADGLAESIAKRMEKFPHSEWFVFDMSIPDLRNHIACGNPVFTRVSELEPEPVCLSEAKGIWLDAFYSDGWQIDRLERWLDSGKQVCLVSPELHRRDPRFLWEKIGKSPYIESKLFSLCTDLPEAACQFFGRRMALGGI